MRREDYFRIGNITVLVVLCFLGLAVSAGWAAISEEEAMSSAKAFCKAFGWEITDTPEVDYRSHRFRDPEWEVEYRADRKEVCLNGESGEFVMAIDYTVRDRPVTLGAPKLSEEQATAVATKYAKIVGIPEDGRLGRVWLRTEGHHLNPDEYEWRVEWDRVFDGVPYDSRNGMHVTLHPDTGQLSGLGKCWNMPEPERLLRLVPREEAVDLAAKHLAERGMHTGALRSAELKIIQPDYYWTDHPIMDLRGQPSAIVWEVLFDVGYVWIGAGTGATLGGAGTEGVVDPAMDYKPGESELPPASEKTKRAGKLLLRRIAGELEPEPNEAQAGAHSSAKLTFWTSLAQSPWVLLGLCACLVALLALRLKARNRKKSS